jgi:hypothetical protein
MSVEVYHEHNDCHFRILKEIPYASQTLDLRATKITSCESHWFKRLIL